MILGPLLMLGLYVFPLWQIMLLAPQYPDPLGLNVHIDGIRGWRNSIYRTSMD